MSRQYMGEQTPVDPSDAINGSWWYNTTSSKMMFRIGNANVAHDLLSVGGGVVPTGTGFRHVTAGVEDAASKLAANADIAAAAGIVESKLSLNYATHSNANDPSAGEKSALPGT